MAERSATPWWKLTAPVLLTGELVVPPLKLKSGTLTIYEHTFTLDEAMAITPSELDDATEGTPYSEPLSVTGGKEPYTWAVTSGQLPEGLTLDPATGVITGTATEPGERTFEVTVTDKRGSTETAKFALIVKASGEDWLGTWTGPVTQIPGSGFPYAVTMNITSVSTQIVGSDIYSTFGCTGELSLVAVTAQTLVLHEHVTQQGSAYTCIDGNITLTSTGIDTADYEWADGGEYTATAPLVRVSP